MNNIDIDCLGYLRLLIQHTFVGITVRSEVFVLPSLSVNAENVNEIDFNALRPLSWPGYDNICPT